MSSITCEECRTLVGTHDKSESFKKFHVLCDHCYNCMKTTESEHIDINKALQWALY